MVVATRGEETVLTVLDSGPMSAIFDNMSIDYEEILDELQSGEFWASYIEDCELCPAYDYELFRKAIDLVKEINPNVHVTNYWQYQDEILNQYMVEYYKQLVPP